MPANRPIRISLLASRYSSASTLFSLYDVLGSVGAAWETFITGEPAEPRFEVKIISEFTDQFACASGALVVPAAAVDDVTNTDIVIVSAVNVSAQDPLDNSQDWAFTWLRRQHAVGTRIVAPCTGVIYLAQAGLLDGKEATTHWAWADLFRREFPKVRLRPERSICFEDAQYGIVTAGGTTAWQELALFLITNYVSVEQAARTAKFFLLADKGELQKPFTAMLQTIPHGDTAINAAQVWIADNYVIEAPVREVTERSGMPPTTFNRRFKAATGQTPQDYVHTVRIEEAKQLLETSGAAVEVIGRDVGYEDPASFRRLFKRKTGMTPTEHRRMFGSRRFDRYRSKH